jgi:hypothetical protein
LADEKIMKVLERGNRFPLILVLYTINDKRAIDLHIMILQGRKELF